jgi:hypothetical protein
MYFREGVATARLDSTDVLIDRSGRVLASDFSFIAGIVSHRRVPVTRGDKSGYLNLQGQVVIPLLYDSVRSFSGGVAAVKKAGKWGYIDPAGDLVIPFGFDEAGPFGSGLAPVRIGTRTGFVDKSGRVAFDLAFADAPGFLMGDEEYNLFVTDRSPDHPPLLGWSDEEKAESCKGMSGRVPPREQRGPPEVGHYVRG